MHSSHVDENWCSSNPFEPPPSAQPSSLCARPADVRTEAFVPCAITPRAGENASGNDGAASSDARCPPHGRPTTAVAVAVAAAAAAAVDEDAVADGDAAAGGPAVNNGSGSCDRAPAPSAWTTTMRRRKETTSSPSSSLSSAQQPAQQSKANTTSTHQQQRHPPPSLPSSESLPSSRTPAAALPPSRTFFDPWNTSSTGHQRAENRLAGSTSWRDSRNAKLREQFKGGLTGGEKRIGDAVGAGSEGFGEDGRLANGGWEKGAKGLRTGGQTSLREIWGTSKGFGGGGGGGKKKVERGEKDGKVGEMEVVGADVEPADTTDIERSPSIDLPESSTITTPTDKKQIFTGLCFYLNGSTAPLVSDHKLKQLLASHGARTSVALGRRSVTHVILGATSSTSGGAGGGLAASKIQKEITRIGGRAVKFVSAEWVLESIASNRRLPESRFAPLKLAHKNQGSVQAMFHAKLAEMNDTSHQQ